MNAEGYRLLIPQYLAGQLDAAERSSFEEKLAESAELRAELEDLRSPWDALGLLPQEQPSAALRARFYQRLNTLQKEERAGSRKSIFAWPRTNPAWQLAAAAVVFAGGILLGRSTVTPGVSHDEVAQLHGEIQNMRQMVALSLLDRQSATARLEGVSWGARVDQPDGAISSALLRALNHDPNVNVRLSSVDALQKFSSDPSIRKAMIDSIAVQDSPLVQISLIDALVQMGDESALPEIRKLRGNSQTNPSVRQRAAWAIQRLQIQ